METLALNEIRRAAKELGLKLRDPKVNCKHCHGRGWIGCDASTGKPIPCNCILPKENSPREVGGFHYKPRNRAERRSKTSQGK